MRDRMERFVVLPFSVGCVSHSSIDVVENQSKKTKEEPNRSPAREGEYLSGENGKNAIGFIPSPRANSSSGLQRLIKGFKSFSHLFVYKEEDGMEMEIGSPKNVQHVAHVGWDDSTSTSTTATSWDGLISPDFLSFHSLSLKQFELAMASRPVTLQ